MRVSRATASNALPVSEQLTLVAMATKFGLKSHITRLLQKIDWRCLGLLGGFRGWPIQWKHAKCCGANPCCHGNDIWPRRGDLVAYRLVCPCSLL